MAGRSRFLDVTEPFFLSSPSQPLLAFPSSPSRSTTALETPFSSPSPCFSSDVLSRGPHVYLNSPLAQHPETEKKQGNLPERNPSPIRESRRFLRSAPRRHVRRRAASSAAAFVNGPHLGSIRCLSHPRFWLHARGRSPVRHYHRA